MKGHDGVLCYYYDRENYDRLDDDQRLGLEIWCQNGKHFKIFCAVWNTLSELMEDLTKIIGESSYDYIFIANGEIFNEDAKLCSIREPGRFGCIKVTALKRADTSDGSPASVHLVECFVQYGMTGFSSMFESSKTLEDYEDVIRYNLAIKKLKHYYFVDYKGNPINPKNNIINIPPLGPTRVITVKNRKSFIEQANEVAKKTQELLDNAPKDKTN